MNYPRQNTGYGPLGYQNMQEGKDFGNDFGGNKIKAVGGGFKEKNTLKTVGKTAAQIVGTIYGGPAGGIAAGMAVDALAPDKQSVKSGTSGFGDQNGKGSGGGNSTQPGGRSSLGLNVATLAAQGYDDYQKRLAAEKATGKAIGPLSDQAANSVNSFAPAAGDAAKNVVADNADKLADGTSEATADSAGNAVMYAKAAYDISNKLNESGVMASESAGGPTMNMDSTPLGGQPASNQSTQVAQPPLGGQKPQFNQDEYMKKFGGYNYGF